MYRKYNTAKAVKASSNERITVFCSIAMKYPRETMSLKTRICKNIAPPKQLNPKLWKAKRSFLPKLSGIIMAYQKKKRVKFIKTY